MTSVSGLGSAQIQSAISTEETKLALPVENIDTEIKTDQTEISAWGSIGTGMSNLSSALNSLSSNIGVSTKVGTSSNTAVASITVGSSATADTYNVTGVKLATGQELYSAEHSSASATLSGGAGSLTFSLANGTNETISLGSSSLSLNGIAKAINSKDGSIKAQVISTSTGARLTFSDANTGSSQAFSVSGTNALAAFSYSSASPGTEVLAQTASDAHLTLNGVPLTSSTNTLTNSVKGVTISLLSAGSTNLNVSDTDTALSNALSAVATNLNSALSIISKETAFNGSSKGSSSTSKSSSSSKKKTNGPLLGDFTATNLSNQLLSAISGAEASGLSAASLGFSVSSSGQVSFDSSKLSGALANNPTAANALINDIYNSLNGVTKGAIGSGKGSSPASTSSSLAFSTANGSIGAEKSALNNTVSNLNTQITAIQKENVQILTTMENEYSTAEAASTTAQLDSEYLSFLTNSSSSSSTG